MYLNGNRLYSTLLGGITTLGIMFVMIIFVITTFTSIINTEQYEMSYSLKSTEQANLQSEFRHIGEFEKYFMKKFFITLD